MVFTDYLIREDQIVDQQDPQRCWAVSSQRVRVGDDVVCELRMESGPAGHHWQRICLPGGAETGFYAFHGRVYGPSRDVPLA